MTAEKLAAQIVDDIFRNGSQETADRLVLTVDTPVPRDLGGWSKRALRDRVAKILAKAEGA